MTGENGMNDIGRQLKPNQLGVELKYWVQCERNEDAVLWGCPGLWAKLRPVETATVALSTVFNDCTLLIELARHTKAEK